MQVFFVNPPRWPLWCTPEQSEVNIEIVIVALALYSRRNQFMENLSGHVLRMLRSRWKDTVRWQEYFMKCTHVLLKHTDIILGKHSSSLDTEMSSTKPSLCWPAGCNRTGGMVVSHHLSWRHPHVTRRWVLNTTIQHLKHPRETLQAWQAIETD